MERRDILLIYSSLTGNTEKVARAIAEVLGIEPLNVRGTSPQRFEKVQLLFVGDGVYALRPSKAMVRFLRALPPLRGTKVALFGTYGSLPTQFRLMRRILEEKGAEIIGEFACPGRDKATLGLLRRGRPDGEDLAAARAFAREMARKAGYALPESSS